MGGWWRAGHHGGGGGTDARPAILAGAGSGGGQSFGRTCPDIPVLLGPGLATFPQVIDCEAFVDLASEFSPCVLVVCFSEITGESWHTLFSLN